MNQLLTVVFMFFLLSQAQSKPDNGDNVIDASTFKNLKDILLKNYTKTEAEANCIVFHFQNNKIVEKFYDPKLSTDVNKLAEEIKPFIHDAEVSCKLPENLPGSSLGTSWIVAIVIGCIVALILVGIFVKKTFMSRVLSSVNSVHQRQRRFLVNAPTSPTRHQLISGIGIPVQLEDEAITFGLVLKAQYLLPETANQLKFNFFPDIFSNYEKDFLWDMKQKPFPNGRRRRREILTDNLSGQTYESYNVTAEQFGDVPLENETNWEGGNEHTMDGDDEFDDQFEEDLLDKKLLEEFYFQRQQNENIEKEEEEDKNDDFDLSPSRWVVYDAFSTALESKGFDGRVCVLRGICEAADVQFSEHLMGELFHIFFTPSSTSETVSKASDYDYIKAELIGRDKTGPRCETVFHQCKRSIMDIITEVHDNPMFQFH